MGERHLRRRGVSWKVFLGASAVLAAFAAPVGASTAIASATAQFVVSDSTGTTSSAAAADVAGVGGAIVADLPAAAGVLADLTAAQAAQLASLPTVTVTHNVSVTMTSTEAPTTLSGSAPAAVFPQQTGATQLWSKGDSGSGVNVAVVDTGIDPLPDFAGRLLPGVDLTGGGNPYEDQYGHGTFVAGLIAGNGATSGGLYKGEAPGAGLISVKVAGADGQTTLATVIEGIDWVIAHQASEDIGVMNLSLGYIPNESTTVNPLDQAVERAWEAGIVVVVSAGNEGPFNGTILSPGDDPLVITVGSLNDHASVFSAGDTMEAFSSAGPTDPDGWFKPDLVTPGTSVVSLMAPGSTVASNNPQAVIGSGNFVGSGTSFSAAITSGAVALLLANNPRLQPDQVKAALLGTTTAGPAGNPFVDGHGLLNVAAAAAANGGMQLQQDAGQLTVSQVLPGGILFTPGETINVGYAVQVPGAHPSLTTSLSGGQLTVPVSCTLGGTAVGDIDVDLPTISYNIAAGSNALTPSSTTLQGQATAPDLCSGALMYGAGHGAITSFTGALLSTDTTDSEHVSVFASAGNSPIVPFGTASAVPVAPTEMGTTVNLENTFSASTWNPALWKGLPPAAPASKASASSITATGLAWNGLAWNGSTWNGLAWNGLAWNGLAWNGLAWNGSAWNGLAWNGSAWNGLAWNGSAWGPAPAAADTASTAPVPTSTSTYPGYVLVATAPDLWCPQGANLGKAGQAGNAGAGGAGGAPGCGSNGGNGGNGGSAGAQGGNGGAGGQGGAGGCPPATDAQMAVGQFPCTGSGSNGGKGGNGGAGAGSLAGGAGGNGGNGGNASGAQGGNGGNGANATSSSPGGAGGPGGLGGGCILYNASYWVTCPANGGHGGNGGNGAAGYAGGGGATGGSAGSAQGTNGANGANGANG